MGICAQTQTSALEIRQKNAKIRHAQPVRRVERKRKSGEKWAVQQPTVALALSRMNVICPNCGGSAAKLSDRECPDCRFDLTLGNIVRHSVRSVTSQFTGLLYIQCPKCPSRIPLFKTDCPDCGESLLIQTSLTRAAPAASWIKQALSPTPAKVNAFQWLFLAASITGFWVMCGQYEARGGGSLGAHGLLAIFVAVFILLTAVIIPRQTLLLVMRGASLRIKLALVLDMLSAFLLVELLMVKWWTRFFGVAMLFASLWVGALLFWRALWPVAAAVSRFFFNDNAFDPKGGQGRRVRMD